MEAFFYDEANEAARKAEYRAEFTKRFSDFAMSRGRDGGEFFETFISMGAEAFTEKYFPEWICNSDFWKLTGTLSDDDFFDFLTVTEHVGRPDFNPEAVYGNVIHSRMYTVVQSHYYDIDAGAPYYARSYYDGAYENEFPMNYDFAMGILLRSFEINESNVGFEEFFSFVGEDTAVELLAKALKEKQFGVEEYFASTFPMSEVEERVRKRVKRILDK